MANGDKGDLLFDTRVLTADFLSFSINLDINLSLLIFPFVKNLV